MSELKNRGAEWRKWDLHYHIFSTKMNNQFGDDKEKYFRNIEESDIQVFGLTDYFMSVDVLNIIEEFYKTYPDSNKVLFPNIEFRLENNVSSNPAGHVNAHLIFDCDLDHEKINDFINTLELVETKGNNTHKKISELVCEKDYSSATIKIDHLIEQLEKNFGTDKPYLFVIAGGGHGGMRPCIKGGAGALRNGPISDELDKKADCIFADVQSQDYYLDKTRYSNAASKPCILASDYHGENSQGQLEKYSWIKSETTFEGLKQILFEPKDRIALQEQSPDTKLDYLVIDNVELPTGKTLYLNSALNAIIGGRSTGKSTLTNTIAKTLHNERYISKTDKEKRGMNVLEEEIVINWRDGHDHEDLEFLPQDHMIRIAEDDVLRNDLVKNIVKSDEVNDERIQKYEEKTRDKQKEIDELVSTWGNLKEDLGNLVKPEGDKEGISSQLEKLQKQIKDQEEKSDFSVEETQNYKEADLLFRNHLNKQRRNLVNIEHLNNLKDIEIPLNIPIPSSDDNEFNKQFEKNIEVLKIETNHRFQDIVESLLSEQKSLYAKNKLETDRISASDIFVKGQENISNNERLKNLIKIAEEEQEKLYNFAKFELEKMNLENQIDSIQKEILAQFSKFKEYRDDLQKEFEIKASPVEIKVDFKFSKFEDKVTYLHGRSAINNTFIDEFNSDFEATIAKIFEEQGLTYNKGKNQNDLIKDIFSKQWSTINYILQYENDDFEQMSQGKKAFVILSLILEFSKDKKPVIIDQPEDSLDNRAIYRDLTNYLKKKKYERQIILVTHNPNVVVGADAENVIVANQHSVDSPNENENKFDYINGALENTGLNRSRFTLSKQGIREHVIEILEGGHEAFEKRELKYKTKKV